MTIHFPEDDGPAASEQFAENAAMQEVRPDDNGDDYLRRFVDIVNETGLEMGLTLTVGGTLVTGIAISSRRFFDLTRAAVLDASPDSEVHQAVASFFDVDDIPENEPDAVTWASVRHVHLRDGMMVAPDGRHGPTFNVWRGRIGAGSGWTLGSLGADCAA